MVSLRLCLGLFPLRGSDWTHSRQEKASLPTSDSVALRYCTPHFCQVAMSEPFDFSFQRYLDTEPIFDEENFWDFNTETITDSNLAWYLHSGRAANFVTSHEPANDFGGFLSSNQLFNNNLDDFLNIDKSALTAEYATADQGPARDNAGSLTDLANDVVR